MWENRCNKTSVVYFLYIFQMFSWTWFLTLSNSVDVPKLVFLEIFKWKLLNHFLCLLLSTTVDMLKFFFQHVLEPSGCFDWIYFVLFETCFRSCFIYYGEQHEFSQFSEGSKLIGMFSISIDFFFVSKSSK